MFAVAFAIRIAIAPHIGFFYDLAYFRTWSAELARIGPRHFYSTDRIADYPPGYLYLLWLVGKVTASPGYLAVKLPPILADLGIAWVAGTFAARLAPRATTERFPVRALVAAAVLFNPAVIALSAVWGQVDSVPAFFVLASTPSLPSSSSPRSCFSSRGRRHCTGSSARSCCSGSRSR
jgi:Gpi18-like mannosyltransferase